MFVWDKIKVSMPGLKSDPKPGHGRQNVLRSKVFIYFYKVGKEEKRVFW